MLIDDFEIDSLRYLGHYLKTWGDSYGLDGEIKGGSIPLGYHTLYITSNYTIRECIESIAPVVNG